MIENIKTVILNSIKNVIKNKIAVMKALVLPILLTSLLLIFQPIAPTFTQTFFIAIANGVICTMLAVTTHRVMLLGTKSVPEWGTYIPGNKELDFFYHSFLIALILIPIIFIASTPVIGEFIAIFAATYIICRLSLVFPSIAVEDSLTLTESWGATHEHQVLMFVVVAIFPMILSVPERLIYKFINGYLALIIVNVITLITLVFIVAALSESYRFIKAQR